MMGFELINQPIEVSRYEVIREIRLHHLDPNDFFEDEGDKEEYTSDTVMLWLGY